MLEYGFSTWPMRKLYIEATTPALDQYGSALRKGVIEEEARLRDFEQYGSSWADLVICSISRRRFTQLLNREPFVD